MARQGSVALGWAWARQVRNPNAGSDCGLCVLRVKARGHRELITVIGHAAVISAGEWVTASGEWVNDRTHGQQFKARFLKTSEPTSLVASRNTSAPG
jgi:hypothetical protein